MGRCGMTDKPFKLRMATPLESAEHIALADFLRWKGVLFNHSPNEGRRLPQYVAKLKKMGMRTGFPDFFIYEARGPFHGLAIEMKRRHGGTVSDVQLSCLAELRLRGYRAEVCRGFDEAVRVVGEYLDGNERKTKGGDHADAR